MSPPSQQAVPDWTDESGRGPIVPLSRTQGLVGADRGDTQHLGRQLRKRKMVTPHQAILDGGAVKPKSPKRLVGRQASRSMPPVCAWTSRGQLQSLNDTLTSGAMDRIEFWQSLVTNFWAEAPSAGAIRLTLSGDGIFEVGTTTATHKVPTDLVAHFFHTWATSAGMTRLRFDFPQAKEGKLPGGSITFLSTSNGSMESLLLEGSLLIRQYFRGRILFDLRGGIASMELQIHSHDEFFLSLRAGHLVAANFNFMSITERPFVCRIGFPASVHRVLDVMLTIGEMLPVLEDSGVGNGWDRGAEGVQTKSLGRRRRRSPTSVQTA